MLATTSGGLTKLLQGAQAVLDGPHKYLHPDKLSCTLIVPANSVLMMSPSLTHLQNYFHPPNLLQEGSKASRVISGI